MRMTLYEKQELADQFMANQTESVSANPIVNATFWSVLHGFQYGARRFRFSAARESF